MVQSGCELFDVRLDDARRVDGEYFDNDQGLWDGAMKASRSALGYMLSAGLLVVCGGCHGARSHRPITAVVSIKVPLGLPALQIPANNPPTVEAIALGRELFYDKRVSSNDSLSCASCHAPQLGFTDGRAVSMGAVGTLGLRNAPTLLNAAYSSPLFWDGRAPNLEEQAGAPIADPVEMNQSHKDFVSRLAATAYKGEFEKVFGPGPITIEKVEMALASFERTLLSGNSAFDRYEYAGDGTALTPAALRGMAVFKDATRGNCAVCHTLGKQDALFTDNKFHNTGIGVDADSATVDTGRARVTHQQGDEGAFRTPTLRNVAITGPYMHNGSLKTLKDVVDFYAGGGNSNPGLDREMKAIHLTGEDRTDLVAFLQSLTGEMPNNVGPPLEGVK